MSPPRSALKVCPCTGCSAHAGGCPEMVSNGRCQWCQRIGWRKDAARRGSPRRRGYDRDHDELRARLLPLAYGKPCPRCGDLMLPGQALDLGHSVDRAADTTARADRMEHASCNRAAGGRVSGNYKA